MTETYSQLLARAFADAGITDAFVVTGGAIAPFTSALAEQGRVSMHFMLNEQSAGVAAEAYGFYDGNPCLLVVTSGPGVTNCLTAVAAAYTNSSPIIVVSGQARIQDIKFAESHKLRQAGNQHLRTREIVSTITNKFYEPTEQVECNELVKDLIKSATNSRKGPTWLSFPIDLQRQKVDTYQFPLKIKEAENSLNEKFFDLDNFATQLEKSQRPAILIGNGARESIASLTDFANRMQIPILTTWPALDLVSENHHLYVGRPGSLPSSWLPNMVNHHSDFLIIVGARLDLAQLGYNVEDFAKETQVWRIDVDYSELQRFSRPNWINNLISTKEFVSHLQLMSLDLDLNNWWQQINQWKIQDKKPGNVNQSLIDGMSTYRVIEFLSKRLCPEIIVTGSSGTCIEMLLQTWSTSSNQRIVNSCGLGSMGFALPAAIGVSYKVNNESVYCVESDGSLAMSLQDLHTIVKKQRNIKIVLLDSGGYKSIDLSQKRVGQHSHGYNEQTGLHLPDISKFALAVGIRYLFISGDDNLDTKTLQFLRTEGSCLVHFKVSRHEVPLPRLVSTVNSQGLMVAPSLIDLQPPV